MGIGTVRRGDTLLNVLNDDATVAHPRWGLALLWITLPAAGVALGRFLTWAVRWLAGQRWAPLPGPVRAVTELPEPPVTIGGALIGALAGLVLAGFVHQEMLRVTVSRTEVTLARPGTTRVVDRAAMAVAFLDRDRLVLLDRVGAELAREPSHLPAGRLAAAFGPAWADRDPYADSYRRWVPESPELPPGARALLTARERALKAGDSHDIAELRDELARLGIVVRDESTRQYWRRVAVG